MAKSRSKLALNEKERQRRSVQMMVRNDWAKEGKPGGEAELKRRRTDPKVLVPLYEKKGFPVPDDIGAQSRPAPPRPKKAPKKGPPQPPPPTKKAARKQPTAAPKRPKAADSSPGAFDVLFGE